MAYLHRYRVLIVLALAALPLYFLYIYDLTGKPPGFYLDEALASFNAYQIAHTGRGEFGHDALHRINRDAGWSECGKHVDGYRG